MNEQESFWRDQYADQYIRNNSAFDLPRGVEAWQTMTQKATDIHSVLECGCNIGRNLAALETLLPKASKSVIEISKPAFDFVTSRYVLSRSFNGAILESAFGEQFDLVFTMGVLIHIHPDDLLANLRTIYNYSRRYVLFGEYFNRTPVMLEYQGQRDKLFKRDFGRYFIEHFDVRTIDYGFLWGYFYDSAGFDDVTWWLFEKDA